MHKKTCNKHDKAEQYIFSVLIITLTDSISSSHSRSKAKLHVEKMYFVYLKVVQPHSRSKAYIACTTDVLRLCNPIQGQRPNVLYIFRI